MVHSQHEVLHLSGKMSVSGTPHIQHSRHTNLDLDTRHRSILGQHDIRIGTVLEIGL